jgi:hypothetical protein
MKRIAQLAAGVLLITGAANVAGAQEASASTSFFKAPVFVLQPGGVTVNAVSAPDGVESATNFNARFATVIPTASPYLQGVFGAQVATGGNAGTPNIFYGAIIPVAPIASATGGMFSFSIDPLGVTTFGGPTTSAGGTFFFLEGAFGLAVGKMMFADMGPMWSGLGAYFLIDQQISGPLPKDESGDADRFRPILLYGLNIPLGFGQ